MNAENKPRASLIPPHIYGMTLAKVELIDGQDYYKLARIEILKKGKSFNVFLHQLTIKYNKLRSMEVSRCNDLFDEMAIDSRGSTSLVGTQQRHNCETIGTLFDIDGAVACAILTENELWNAVPKWRIFDRQQAREENGLETIAEKSTAVTRLFVCLDQRSGAWISSPRRFDDWKWRAAERGWGYGLKS